MRMPPRQHVSLSRIGLASLLVLGGLGPAFAQQDDASSLVEKLEHGQVDWTNKVIVATGSGAPNLKGSNVAQVRLAAERAAKVAAYRNVLETVKGVKVTAAKTGEAALASAQVRTQVQGIIRACKTKSTRYYSDGGVDVVIECKLDGGIASVIAPVRDRKTMEGKGEAKFSGLIIDATELGASPALAPRLIGPDGKELYVREMVKPSALRRDGAAAFVTSVDEAKTKEDRVGKNPLIIKASRVGDVASDIIIDEAEAKKLEGHHLGFLAEARVVIATKAP